MTSLLGPLGTTSLIFGGCCANVFALEGIIRSEPGSGLLITFFQFLQASLFAYATQLDFGPSRSAFFLRTPKVPLARWGFVAALFFSVNMLNNWAFAYKISVPVHIILRSFGSVTTMIAGALRGKRYTSLQVLSVAVLTLGVLISAWADSESKGRTMSLESQASTSEFVNGLGILLIAQILSAYMGAYTEDTYAKYNAGWTENLFYSHFFSLPLFLPFSPTIVQQYHRLSATPQFQCSQKANSSAFQWLAAAAPQLTSTSCTALNGLPEAVVYLFINAGTQLACISGVNLLSAQSSAVTVTIVLNIRKLVSFILSTLIFGHDLNPRMIVGSVLVFGSGALYGWETSWRIPRARLQRERAAKKTK